MTLLDVRTGDLATARADLIATSANADLAPRGGADGALHAAAGPALADACRRLGTCPPGEVRTTPAGALHARLVAHAVVPRRADGGTDPEALAGVYRAVAEAAVANDCRTVALPSFGTGAAGVAPAVAAPAAVRALKGVLLGQWGTLATRLRIIRWWVADDATAAAYRAAIDAGDPRLRPVRPGDPPLASKAEEPTSDTRPLPFRREIGEDDLTLVRAGLPAVEMEEKWVVRLDGDRLRFLRSWTGYEVFTLRVRPRPGGEPGAVLDQLHVCDDPERYTGTDGMALDEIGHVLRRVLREP